MSDLGQFSVLLGLFLCSYAVLVDLLGSWRKDDGFIKSARNATAASFACLTVAMIVLWLLLVRSDFTVEYVAAHTSKALPLAYKLSALWAGAAGSLLLWLWMQVGLVVYVYCIRESKERRFSGDARIMANLANVFFFLVLVIDKSPFALVEKVLPDGAGLNPLLQHAAMVLHPPILFVGYAAFIIPFAWSFACIKENPKEALAPYFARARYWNLVAWLFLTVGIVLGAWWAYEELGWGGYWAWDPVENASLLPWLISTALLHCFRTYKPRSSTATWTIILSSLSFSLCVLGRFLTKYGSKLFDSVHTFGDPGWGMLYLVLLIHVWFILIVLLIRDHIVNKKEGIESTARSNRFVILNNWMFVILTIMILVGTLFPFLSKIFIKVVAQFSKAPMPHKPISLAPEFFTKVTAPGGMALLLLIALCPFLLAHGFKKHWRTILAVLAVVVALAVWLFSCVQNNAALAGTPDAAKGAGQWLMKGSLAIPCFIFSGLILVGLIGDVIGYERRLAKGRKTGSKARRNLRWYGARIVHLGVAMMFIGIAGSGGYDLENIIPMRVGDKALVGIAKDPNDPRGLKSEEYPRIIALRPGMEPEPAKYGLKFERLSEEEGPNFRVIVAHISVHQAGGQIAELKPAKAIYSASNQSISEIDVRRTFGSDLYLALEGVDPASQIINLRVMVKPLINWIWIGSFVMVLGTLAVLISPYRNRGKAAANDRKDTGNELS
ncbi:MAG: heme lyase CcmF/NrfE family subunit [Planctomycetota bacterium]|jgi:cytochrome c-type biogenesis protein CcmF